MWFSFYFIRISPNGLIQIIKHFDEANIERKL